ncbi:MAG: sigma-70 family RNA polymerase sigma factor [Psychroflexus sp.]|nr:sigma-70 family RNA polymerase sigma factor [Psychroflexus sp.]MDN6310983.1 sigma-70 family RNA polymerase sigma factor [Psychroflexus sp.]
MSQQTSDIWNDYSSEMYFFCLKKVQNEDIAKEVLQNTFFKIHDKLNQLKSPSQVRSWAFQILRNEIINYYRQDLPKDDHTELSALSSDDFKEQFCCFERFIDELPTHYKTAITLVYIKGHQQAEAAEIIGISLSNLKARVRRAKSILKKRFNECCQFSFNDKGELIGDSDCAHCE